MKCMPIFEYAKYDRSEFIDTITMAQSTQEDAEVKKVRANLMELHLLLQIWTKIPLVQMNFIMSLPIRSSVPIKVSNLFQFGHEVAENQK